MAKIFTWLVLACFACFSAETWASVITYDVTVATTSVSGQTGSLDFNFNPGPTSTQSASVQILNFSSNGTLVAGTQQIAGDVSPTPLPSTVTFLNDQSYNDYFQQFTYGTTLSFHLSLYGPALSSPDGVSTSGSSFAFSMFSDSNGTVPILTSDAVNGFAFIVNVNLDGTTNVTNTSPQTTVAAIAPVPLPAALPMMAAGLLGLAALRGNKGKSYLII